MAKKSNKTMDELMGVTSNLPIQQLRRGDVVEGTIIQISDKEALVDVGAKSEGVIPQAEIKGSKLQVGDKVLVYVLTPEDRRGQMLVSIDRAEIVKNWIDLEEAFKTGETLEIKITGHNRGGLLGDIKGLMGFVPFSHTESAADLSGDKTDLQSLLDKMIDAVLKVRVIELDRVKNRIILSEKEAVLGEALEKRREKVSKLSEGDLVTGQVSAVMPYGLMVTVENFEGLIPREEMSWDEEAIDDILGSFEIGGEVKSQVIEVDKELGKVKLSLKNIVKNPWEEIGKKFKKGDSTTGVVTKITSYGVFAGIFDEIEGMIPLSSIPENEKLEIGKEIKVKIETIDIPKRRLDLLYES